MYLKSGPTPLQILLKLKTEIKNFLNHIDTYGMEVERLGDEERNK